MIRCTHGRQGMTTAEMIAALQAYPPDTRVLVDGYEGGLDDPASLRFVRGVLTYDERGYFGLYSEQDKALDDIAPAIPLFDALVIPRP